MDTLISSVDITIIYHRGHRENIDKKREKRLSCFGFFFPLCPLWLIGLHEVLLKIFRKSLDRRLNWPRRGITERTKRFAFDVVAEIEQQLRVFRPSTATFDPFENLHQPIGPFATRCAPAARFVL